MDEAGRPRRPQLPRLRSIDAEPRGGQHRPDTAVAGDRGLRGRRMESVELSHRGPGRDLPPRVSHHRQSRTARGQRPPPVSRLETAVFRYVLLRIGQGLFLVVAITLAVFLILMLTAG